MIRPFRECGTAAEVRYGRRKAPGFCPAPWIGMGLFRKDDYFNQEYRLNEESVDRIAEKIEEYLRGLEQERANILRIRLSMEEALLRWMQHFGKEATVKLELGRTWGRPTITLSLRGDSWDFMSTREDDLGQWADTLLSSMGLIPRFSYQNGANRFQIRLKRVRRNPALDLLIAVLLGLLFGAAGRLLLPDPVRDVLLQTILDPVLDAFLRILNAVSGPVIFLSVIAAICSAGSVSAMNRSGTRMITRFLLLSLLCGLVTITASSLAFRTGMAFEHMDRASISGLLDLFLQIIPSDALSPFINGNSPQLLLIALLLAYALLTVGPQADGLVALMGQADTIGLTIADWVSRLSPFFITVLLILGIWDGSARMLVGLWQPLAIFLVISFGALAAALLRTGGWNAAGARKLFGKMKDSFRIALRTASVDAAFGASQNCCERRLGISRKLCAYGMPLGLVIYMPSSIIAAMTIVMYTADCYQVEVTGIWLLTAMLLTVALIVATPPVAGVSLLTYAAIFSQLGIPVQALTVALVADILFGFAAAAVNQALLQLELVGEADRLGMLDRGLLRK